RAFPDSTQLGLFDVPAKLPQVQTARPAKPRASLTPAPRPTRTQGRPSLSVNADRSETIPERPSPGVTVDQARTVAVSDMPTYAPELVEAVDRIIADLGADRMLFTYRLIEKSFGISRATVSRRLKEGLVPGVRIADGRVLEEGHVRRFDRAQVRW